MKVDPNGSVIWSQTYDQPVFNSGLFAVKEIWPGGDLIAVGRKYFGSCNNVLLLRTNSNGDSLWMRTYAYSDSLMTDGRGSLWDVVPSFDGGFVAVGTAYSACTGSTPPGYTQDVWVVKVDSMGCLVPGCHIVTDMTTQITNHRDALHVWPNPVSETLYLSWQLPDALQWGKSCQLSVVSAAGKLVRTERISLVQEQFQLDVHDLSPGLYHLHLVSDGVWVTGGKFVVSPP
ncbi:MAG: T9SS type A sorting domain-containing protein [Flavobacteriales bacterium]|nr:T9SS type A sorting domain-containing protein [Flavobacteriales bacterium]